MLRSDNGLRLQHRLTHRLSHEYRTLFKPAPGSRSAPKRLALRIAEIPSCGRVVGIGRQIIAGKQLDAMAVGIAQI